MLRITHIKQLTISEALSRDKSNMNTEYAEENEEHIYHINAIKIIALKTTTLILAWNDYKEHQNIYLTAGLYPAYMYKRRYDTTGVTEMN